MTRPILQQLRDFALQFARALIAEDFDAAYAMTSASFRPTTSPARLRREWRTIIPADWGPMTYLDANRSNNTPGIALRLTPSSLMFSVYNGRGL
jgi:hypothetical protein